jgi:hypothetical protein
MTEADRLSATPRPIAWISLTPDEAAEEWDSLREWVTNIRDRFPNMTRLPDCWYRHNELVEALSALRDHERACFAPNSHASGPVEWHRAFREMEARMETWVKRFTCNVPGRGHDVPGSADGEAASWNEFVEADVARRRQPEKGECER